jgi:hypothetical protein
MKTLKHAWLFIRALYELARYEVIIWLCGSARILRQLRRQSIAAKPNAPKPNAAKLDGTKPDAGEANAVKAAGLELERTICEAVLLAACFYWKPVLCLQRAVCTVRLLRRHSIVARLVIGYRPSPFFSHAWVEVDGRVVYGSPAYQKRLTPLHVA